MTFIEPIDPTTYFSDDNHALYTGALAGLFMRAGIPVEVVDDAEGNHTAELIVEVAIPGAPVVRKVRLFVRSVE